MSPLCLDRGRLAELRRAGARLRIGPIFFFSLARTLRAIPMGQRVLPVRAGLFFFPEWLWRT